MPPDWITPDWPAPANVHAFMTTRAGGVSQAPFASFNPASHVDDDPAAVAENRRRLRQWLPAEPLWLNQVHGREVACAVASSPPIADAGVAFHPGEVRAVLTADCLPVLFCDEAGTVVAAAHAGWRGLRNGVLEATVAAMRVPPERLLAWLGAAIGPAAFEIGPEVREAFVSRNSAAESAFTLTPNGKYLADLYALARLRLAGAGVTQVWGGDLCTYSDPRFFSYRREPRTGRMASVIWRD